MIGMSVKSCVEYYDREHGPGAGDTARVAEQVSVVKEGYYRELTAAGIAALDGVQAAVKELKSLGIQFGIASSGELTICKLQWSYCVLWGRQV